MSEWEASCRCMGVSPIALAAVVPASSSAYLQGVGAAGAQEWVAAAEYAGDATPDGVPTAITSGMRSRSGMTCRGTWWSSSPKPKPCWWWMSPGSQAGQVAGGVQRQAARRGKVESQIVGISGLPARWWPESGSGALRPGFGLRTGRGGKKPVFPKLRPSGPRGSWRRG